MIIRFLRIVSFYVKKNERNYYRDKDCMRNVCKDLTEYVMNTNNFERLKMLPLTEKEKSHFKQKPYIWCKSKFNTDFKIYWKVWDHNHYTAKCRSVVGVHIYNLRYKNRNEIPLVLHNGSNYNYKRVSSRIWRTIWILRRKHGKAHIFFSNNPIKNLKTTKNDI